MNNQYGAIIKSFKDKHLLVIGDIILDSYIFGRVNRISPEAPVPVVEVKAETCRLGGAANVANNIVSLGGKATIAGIIGNDKEGELLREQCKANGIGTEGIVLGNRPTTVKTRIIAHHQQVVRVDREDARTIGPDSLSKLMRFIGNNCPAFDGVIISDYKKGVVSEGLVGAVIRSSKGGFVAVDPKIGNFHCYKGASIITPNTREASEGSGIAITDDNTLVKAGLKLIRMLCLSSLLITRGEQGMSLFQKDAATKKIRVHHVGAVAKNVFDVTGAGDTVIAVFALAHLSGASLVDAAKIANCAAGVVVGEVGTATCTPEELLKYLSASGS